MYYSVVNGVPIFAPRLPSFLQIDGFKPEIDREALQYYLSCGYCPDRRTILKGVRKVLPAETVWFKNGRVQHKKYWSPPTADKEPLDEKYWIRGLREVLQCLPERLRTQSDGFIGVMLSGGLDSSLVASLMALCKPLKVKLVGYTLDYGGGVQSELQMAETVAGHLGMELRVVKIDHDRVMRELEHLQELYDEPLVKFTFIPTYYLMEEAAKEVDLLVTGDGGDELFFGYRTDYWEEPWLINILSKPGALGKPVLGLGRMLCNPLADWTGSTKMALAAELFGRENATHPDWYYRTATRVFQPYFSDEELERLLHQKATFKVSETNALSLKRAIPDNRMEKMSHTMLGGSLPADLMRLEKGTLATGLKTWSPLLEPEVIEMAMRIPVQVRHRRGTTKYLLRQLIREYGLLPDEAVDSMAKVGLDAPIQRWLMDGRYRDYFEKLVGDGAKVLGIDEGYAKKFYSPRTHVQALKAWAVVGVALWVRSVLRQ